MYCIGHVVKDYSDSKRGNLLPPLHGLLFAPWPDILPQSFIMLLKCRGTKQNKTKCIGHWKCHLFNFSYIIVQKRNSLPGHQFWVSPGCWCLQGPDCRIEGWRFQLKTKQYTYILVMSLMLAIFYRVLHHSIHSIYSCSDWTHH